MFHKFPKITNVGALDPYEGKYISAKGSWYVTEKIDGCNTSIIVDRDRKVSFAGRTQVINDSYDVYGLRENISKFQDLVAALIDIADSNHFETLNVYGEYYGLGIQKRIYYGDEKQIRVYAALVNDSNWLSFSDFRKVFGSLDKHWLIPILGEFNSWNDALEYANGYGVTNNQVSVLSKNDPGEGVVLYPANKAVPEDFVAYKVKTERFLENKVSSVDVQNALGVIDGEHAVNVERAREILFNYVNENRVYGLISKVGKPSQQEIGKFLGLLVDDAIEDAKSDYPELFNQLDDKEIKKISKLKRRPFVVFNNVINQI